TRLRDLMRIALASNPSAGHGRHTHAAELARTGLVRRGHDVLVVTASSYDATREAATALLENHELDALVVVGGDGMVHLGLDVVALTGVPLGIVAVGTGNDVARHYGLPSRDVEASLDVIDTALRAGHVVGADAIHVTRPDGTPVAPEHEWCMATVGTGVEAAVNARANALVWPHGEARYTVAVLGELARLRPYGYRVTTDSGTWEGGALILTAANTRYIGGGMDLAPRASTTDGLLEVLRLDPLPRTGLLRLLSKVFTGGHLGHPSVHAERTRTVVIEALEGPGLRLPPHPMADGEPLTPLPLRLEAVAAAVRVLVPAPADEDASGTAPGDASA
ncbi:diacylglycerol kinase family protein, partial [Actinomyces sp. 186855]